MSFCNQLTSWIVALLAAQFLYATYIKFFYLMNPLSGVDVAAESASGFIKPLWKEGEEFKLIAFLSHTDRFSPYEISSLKGSDLLLIEKAGLVYNSSDVNVDVKLRIVDASSNYTGSDRITVNQKVWENLRKDAKQKQAVFLHIHIYRTNKGTVDRVNKTFVESGDSLYGVVKMTKQDKLPKDFSKRYLLSDWGLAEEDDLQKERLRMNTLSAISFWKPEVAVRIVTDFTTYPRDFIPPAIGYHVVPLTRRKLSGTVNNVIAHYKPPLHVDEIGLTSDKYVPLNNTVYELPLTISYAPMTIQRFLLMSVIEESLKTQSGMGFTAQDMDDVRRLISDTSLYLLGATILASVLHLFFEFLAFKSDISFWQGNKSLAGLSAQAVVSDFFSQIVIFLFLIDSDTSLLVTIPAFFGILIQGWKVHKATGVKFCLSYPFVTFERWQKEAAGVVLEFNASERNDSSGSLHEVAKASIESDRLATGYLISLLVPLAIGFSLRMLIVERHISWYSWGISALTGCVYTFGFILMCPQLFINHKLKTVSHLPWNFLIFRFLNTFIDDLFAFIIRMPTMHRLSVFRDDIVFFVYLYQRYIYRVDESRPIEK